MKMLKKLLAVVLTGAMALTLLTACGGNAVTEKDIVDAMNDMVKAAGDDVTTFTPRAEEREMAKAIAALSDKDWKDTERFGQGENAIDLPKKAVKILGIDGDDNFVWFGEARADEIRTSGQALQFMTHVYNSPLNGNKGKLNSKAPKDTRHMGTALYKTVDDDGKPVTKRIIVVTAEPAD